jgi:nitronate monooxygenase
MSSLPIIIQGGMGAGVSNWRLAQAVSKLGQLGVVSGTALDQILARRLQDGDLGGHMRRAIERFPFPKMAQRIWESYFVPGGKKKDEPYKTLPMFAKENPRALSELCIVSNFVEVNLAREGHDNPVGMNYLEKIQMPHLPSIYGAMLAGVSYILMGAGIPIKIPDVIDRFLNHEPATYPLHVAGAEEGDDNTMTFAPSEYMEHELPPLQRPNFLAIIASNILAVSMLKKTEGRIEGFIIEGPTAGGHNAPPRGKLQLTPEGEAIYGERDKVDLAKIRELGKPFWLAGGYGTAQKLREALAAGAAGVQVGTAFAYCAESGMREDYKHALLEKVAAGTAKVFTDPIASPTNFPFKVARLEGTISEPDVFKHRARICDLGFLREAYRTKRGGIGYRCSAEPQSLFVSKGGKLEETVGRKCICNALLATVGYQQVRKGNRIEQGIVTSGDDLTDIGRFMPPGGLEYTAEDVVNNLLAGAA